MSSRSRASFRNWARLATAWERSELLKFCKRHGIPTDVAWASLDDTHRQLVLDGDGAYTAAGSVITDDVPAGSMAVGRARQRNILDWVLRKRAGSSSAQAAQRAQQEES